MKKSNPFDKFARKKSNAAIKEAFKQEKRKWKKERAERIEQQKTRSAVPVNTVKPGIEKKSALMPLNKFIAHSGICSRRDAAELVRKGQVKVNGAPVTEPGHKVSDKDEITLNGKRLTPAKEMVYILLNKPKDYLTTTEDPQKRKTVLELVRNATRERIYPVGRLDRNTSGVLLLTNDGDLSQMLTHPSHEIKKVYAVTLDRPLEKADFIRITQGILLEDGMIKVDALAYSDQKDRTQLGLEIHSGRNRVVRRIFEHLGYQVKGLDRVMFAGLTKKNVQRGKWRFLNEKEIRQLKYFNHPQTRPAASVGKNKSKAGTGKPRRASESS